MDTRQQLGRLGWARRAVLGAIVVVAVAAPFMASSGSDGEPGGAPGAGAGTGAGTGDAGPAADVRPNIVLIMTDDMTADEMRYLPRTQRLLGDQGVTFGDFVAPHPLCCPARAEMLTGQYGQNNGVRSNDGPLGGYQAFDPTTALPVWLQQAGYTTAMVGKYLNGYAGPGGIDPTTRTPEVGWDHWDPTVRRIYQYFGYTQYRDGRLAEPAAYHTDYVARQSKQLINDLTGAGEPFFLWSSFVGPHGRCQVAEEARACEAPPVVAPRYRQLYRDQVPASIGKASFNEPDVSDKPRFLDRPLVTPYDMVRLQTRRANALAAVDEAVAGIVRTLRRAHALDDTLIVFTSDNGYLLGEHRYVGKILAYEESLRVPLVMRGLGLPSGKVDNQTAAMIDLAPTFASLAGATPLVEVDGRPLVARRGPTAAETDSRTLLLLAGTDNLRVNPTGWWFRGVRTARFSYWRFEANGFEELYDRERDPDELDNVADDPAYLATRTALAARLAALQDCAGVDCKQSFEPLPDPDTGP